MPHSQESNLKFLSEAMARLTGSLDMQKSLIDTFEFLAEHFPIDAISLHQYSPDLKALKLLFLVQAGRFDFVEMVAPLSEEAANSLFLHNQGVSGVIKVPLNMDSPVSALHSETLSELVPLKERAYMVCVLRSEKEVLGHLCLMGTHPDCFTEEHERKFSLLVTPFALTMSNLLQYQRTMEFQDRLRVERDGLEKDLENLRERRIVGEQGGLKSTMEVVRQLENREVPALIMGETGVGKELIADAIQAISPRKNKPFVKVNCGAIPDSLVDSELFGYEKGAFTGATTSRPGRFEQANGGTLFLDEIGELPLQAQVRLLRVLQNNVVERIGSTKSIEVDVRVIAATNRNLELMLQEGTFREDLYYRLYVFPVQVPPLRERTQDIPELIYLFMKRGCDELGIKSLPQLPEPTVDRLLQYSWPGNVRELENLVKRGLTLYPHGPLLLDKLLPQDEGWYISPEEGQSYFEKTIDARVELMLEKHLAKLNLSPGASQPLQAGLHMQTEIKPLEQTIKEAIVSALAKTGGRINGPGGAAELLDLNPSTLRSKMRKMGLKASEG
ncbi:sigma-54 interaction domain-containing protein [Maridesulfovibrio sp.]|uniref:sigma-54 interaction domain-containing protein n=1 Tax=Maridesulfovibrio sp. TaxID=2795000 RepID=UPI003BA9CEED